jgi:cold shock CspA family protein
MFSSSGMYGFAVNSEDDEVFFHAQDFHRLEPGGPLPVLGEPVLVEDVVEDSGRRPRAGKVHRTRLQKRVKGTVKSFDSRKGWGFVTYGDSQAFLHASEAMDGWLPVIGTEVAFYVGTKKGKPRACWVRPTDARGTVSF